MYLQLLVLTSLRQRIPLGDCTNYEDIQSSKVGCGTSKEEFHTLRYCKTLILIFWSYRAHFNPMLEDWESQGPTTSLLGIGPLTLIPRYLGIILSCMLAFLALRCDFIHTKSSHIGCCKNEHIYHISPYLDHLNIRLEDDHPHL